MDIVAILGINGKGSPGFSPFAIKNLLMIFIIPNPQS